MLDDNNKQLAPCIVSKAKVAFALPNRYRNNLKRCSRAYWERAIRVAAAKSNRRFTEKQIQNAIRQY